MADLLPCPFCGGDAAIRDDLGHFYVACNTLHCFCCLGEGYDRDAMPEHVFISKEVATKAWNTRHDRN